MKLRAIEIIFYFLAVLILVGCSATNEVASSSASTNATVSDAAIDSGFSQNVSESDLCEPSSTEVISGTSDGTNLDSLRDSYPYVNTYNIAYEDTDMTLEDYIEDTSLVRFTVVERLEDIEVETDMMSGIGMSAEELKFYEEAGMRYLTTTFERYAIEITASANYDAGSDTIEFLHNTMFGEMYSLLEPGKEFVAFLTESEDGLICNFETLYYYTDSGELLSVVADPVSAELDGVTWEQVLQTYVP